MLNGNVYKVNEYLINHSVIKKFRDYTTYTIDLSKRCEEAAINISLKTFFFHRLHIF